MYDSSSDEEEDLLLLAVAEDKKLDKYVFFLYTAWLQKRRSKFSPLNFG